MIAKEAIYQALIASPAVSALVATRVYYDVADNAALDALPFLIIQQISSTPRYSLDGGPQVLNRYQITVVASGPDQAADVAAAVIEAMQWLVDPSSNLRQLRYESMTTEKMPDADAVTWFLDFMATEDCIQ